MMKVIKPLTGCLAALLISSAHGNDGPVLVTGATGQTGRLVVAHLIETGSSVRALTRSPDKAASLGTGVEIFAGDVTDPASLAEAFEGAAVVISTIGARFPIGDNGFAAVDWEGNRALIDAAKTAGVRQFILLSAGSAGRDGFPYSWSISPYPWKAKAEAYLRDSGLPYTIIAAGGLRDEPGGQKGIRLAPRADYESGQVSRSDVAAVLVACIENAAARGKTITVVNADSLSVDGWRRNFDNLPADP